MKILLVPWIKSWVFALRIYKYDDRELYSNDHVAQITTARGQRIALVLIQRYAESLKLSIPEFLKNSRMIVEAEIPDPVGERLLFTFKHLGRITESRLIPEELAENPSLEDLERFLSIKKLLG